MGKRELHKTYGIVQILTLALAIIQPAKSNPRNPFLIASESGITLPQQLTHQYASLQTQTVSLNTQYENLKTMEESNAAIDFSMNEKQKCHAWMNRYQQRWHRKKIDLDEKIWEMENSHSRKMLEYTDYSKHKEIVTKELESREREFEMIKQNAKDARETRTQRIAELRKKMKALRDDYYRISEETIETQQKLEIVKKRVVEKREEIKIMKRVEKLKLSMFFMDESIIETRIRVMNGKCNAMKKKLEEKLTKVYNVKSQVKAHLSVFQGKKPEPVEPVEIPSSIKKVLKETKIEKKEENQGNLDLDEEPAVEDIKPKKKKPLFEDHDDAEEEDHGVQVNNEKNTRDLLKQTLTKLKKKQNKSSLFDAFIPKKKKTEEPAPAPEVPQPHHSSNLFSSFTHPKKTHSSGLFSGFHKPKKIEEFHKKSSSLFGSLVKPKKKKHSLLGGLLHHTKERYNTRHVQTETSEEERPAGQRVTYVVNGKEITEEEFQKMKQKGAKVKEERHTEHLKPIEKVVTEEVPSEQTETEPVYEINGKQITQSEYLKMKAQGLVE